MCGIAGIFGAGGSAASKAEAQVEAMTRRLHHRGPDGWGTCQHGRAHLGSTRLSLLDLEHGAQPAWSRDRRWALAYNGEIYNHEELRRSLATRGAVFAGRCDTEVVLTAFELDGVAALESFEGMYAFAASDGGRLWLARDPFGIKPLCYALVDDGRRLLFASEVKALLPDPSLPRRLDPGALLEQSVFGFHLEGKTLLAGVRELAPGTWLRVEVGRDGRLSLTHGEHSPPRPVDLPESEDEVVDLLVARLRASVAEQRVADHPVGAYLSGGLDSSLLVTLMAEGASGPVHTFATADAPDHPDLVMARRVAEHLGTRHHERLVGPRELLAALPASVLALESTGLPSIAEVTAPEIRRHVKAALCGDGADELFAGYVMHARPGEWVSRFAQGFNRLVAGGGIRKEDAAPTVAVLHSLAPRLGLEGEGEGEGDLRERFYRFYLGAQLTSGHLRRWDLGTMAHGLELRVPYLSRPLRDLALALPWSHRLGPRATKRALRQAGKKILPPALAQEVIERRKLAAPAAYRRRARVLDRYLRRLLPAGWESQEHPLRPYYGSALERCLLDLFLFAFIARGGELPEGFQVGDLYQRHREELEAALESSWAASRRA